MLRQHSAKNQRTGLSASYQFAARAVKVSYRSFEARAEGSLRGCTFDVIIDTTVNLGLKMWVRRVGDENLLCGEVESADILKELPKFGLRRNAQGSIGVQEAQPPPL